MNLTDIITLGEPVALEEMLDARERRAVRQQELLAAHNAVLVCLTLNIPGQHKAYPLVFEAFAEGRDKVAAGLRRAGLDVAATKEFAEKTGPEGYWAVRADADAVKRLTMGIEESHPLGRLFDLDVLGADGQARHGVDAGRTVRACFICGKPVWECSRSRAHSAEELSLRTAGLLRDWSDERYAETIASLAVKAMLQEVAATPKPGLVDRANNGSHRDMDMFTFIGSAAALAPYFRDLVLRGIRFDGEAADLLPAIRLPGQWAEDDMFAVTGGVNTHKGMIFSLGVFCAALGHRRGRGLAFDAASLLQTCAAITAPTPSELDRAAASQTHGERVHGRYGLTGIRGEAAHGYPHVRDIGYPVLKARLEQGCSLNDAGVIALLHLIARVEDTNIVARSDLDTLRAVQQDVSAYLKEHDDPESLLAYAKDLDRRFIEKNISPGGSADLLALSYFLHLVLSGRVF